MIPRPFVAACALALFAAPALAQSQLTYDQPLAPAAVRSVQDRLRQLGAYTGVVDGIWGEDSAAALRQFQQGHGLQATGQLNQATAAMLNLNPAELLAAAAADQDAAQAPRPLSSVEVRNLQSRLRDLGYYRGSIDGAWGAGTQDALQRFQQSSGIQVTGRVNPQTVTALGLNPADPGQKLR
ncbi:Peptidoglycan-binding protein [Rhodovastum atsumiense]|nr:peptidoglycan-binding domain-containing protein [Rhodovastum atsumiense]CAH2598621.1 Peptidoglycan-binding protein [Rhodovastum atsumiense]